jgi:hypothetical protein
MRSASFIGQKKSSRIFMKSSSLLAAEQTTWNLNETSVFQVQLIM